MEVSDLQLAAAFRLAIAALIGLAVGLEREWSGHATGPAARFAGLRTFLILGLLGGTAGLFLHDGYETVAAALIAGGGTIAIVAYLMSVWRRPTDLDGTTEVAALLVVALGALAGTGYMLIAAAAGSVMVLALNEKKRLHEVVGTLQQEELRGALQFSVLALVVLPVLPERVDLQWIEIRPRALWMVVLLFCALNFAGFVAHRKAGRGRGYLLTGLIGGVISSTAITLGFAQHSRRDTDVSFPLAAGVVGACTVLVPRVLVISAVLNPSVAIGLLPYIVPAGLIGAGIVAYAWWFDKGRITEVAAPAAPSWLVGSGRSPLRLGVAMQLAVLFQIAIVTIGWISSRWTVEGLYGTAAIMGLTNADALTVAMSAPTTAITPLVAARAIAIGILANTLVKLGISAVMGSQRFRLVSGLVLLLMGVAIVVPLLLL